MTAERVATGGKARVIVLASTYPRWHNDHEPSFVHALARRLTDRFDVIAVVPHAPGAARYATLDGVTVSRYRYAPEMLETLVNDGGIASNLRRMPWKWLLLPSFIFMQWFEARRWARDGAVIHAHWIIPQGLVARALRKPTLLTCHGADVFSLRGRGASWLKGVALRWAETVTVVSTAMVELLQALAAVGPHVRPMGVDLENAFTPSEQPRADSQMLFVGRLVEKKGLDVLLRAMAAVIACHPGVRLSVVGHGPLDAALRAEAVRLGVDSHVDFLGPVTQDRLAALYRQATLFVSPFRPTASGDQEGLGLVMVEALGCGCPVVASDLPATRDVLVGTPGSVMVPTGDVDALAKALVTVLDDPRPLQQAALSGIPRLRDRFDWSSVARGYADLLQVLHDEGRCRD